MYQSIPAFAPLIQEIFRREDLPFSPLSPLTPGTNAVFRSGELVVKVFFPKESGLDPEGAELYQEVRFRDPLCALAVTAGVTAVGLAVFRKKDLK